MRIKGDDVCNDLAQMGCSVCNNCSLSLPSCGTQAKAQFCTLSSWCWPSACSHRRQREQALWSCHHSPLFAALVVNPQWPLPFLNLIVPTNSPPSNIRLRCLLRMSSAIILSANQTVSYQRAYLSFLFLLFPPKLPRLTIGDLLVYGGGQTGTRPVNGVPWGP